jgi:hypothetical protein
VLEGVRVSDRYFSIVLASLTKAGSWERFAQDSQPARSCRPGTPFRREHGPELLLEQVGAVQTNVRHGDAGQRR